MGPGATVETDAASGTEAARTEVEPALAVYGICVVCQEKTPMARLVLAPATSLCLSCAGKEARFAVA